MNAASTHRTPDVHQLQGGARPLRKLEGRSAGTGAGAGTLAAILAPASAALCVQRSDGDTPRRGADPVAMTARETVPGDPRQVVAFSGGKDSTALVLRLAELGEEFVCLFTPTGDELPDLLSHITTIVDRIKRPLVLPTNQSLYHWIDFHQALPNWRMRWCTRQIKIEPCIAYLQAHPGSSLLVGLRADEESRIGLYGDYATYRYPLREWGWDLRAVQRYLKAQNVTVPTRTDCALCYGQRLSEWYQLWQQHPDRYERGVQLEQQYGHTFRSAQRDTWPAALSDLRLEFESGRIPKGVTVDPDKQACRVCQL
jgi:hypothetical protein